MKLHNIVRIINKWQKTYKCYRLRVAWIIIGFEFDSYKPSQISWYTRKEFYLEFLVLFIHLDPETNWSKIEDGNIDKKDKNRTYAYEPRWIRTIVLYLHTCIWVYFLKKKSIWVYWNACVCINCKVSCTENLKSTSLLTSQNCSSNARKYSRQEGVEWKCSHQSHVNYLVIKKMEKKYNFQQEQLIVKKQRKRASNFNVNLSANLHKY